MPCELRSSITGSVWGRSVAIGQDVCAGTAVLVLECMKMEVPVETPIDGTVVELAEPGTQVVEGDVVAVIVSHGTLAGQ
jgi:biotin carboxyl carrier protein